MLTSSLSMYGSLLVLGDSPCRPIQEKTTARMSGKLQFVAEVMYSRSVFDKLNVVGLSIGLSN